MSTISLPTLTARGSRTAIGHAQGEAFRDTIRAFVPMRFDAAVTYFAEAGGGTVDRLRAVGHASYEVFSKWCPDARTEHDAVAAAAGVDPLDLYTAANYTDMRDAVILAGQADAEGCSAVLVPGARTTSGSVLAGQTWDLNPQDIDYVVAVHRVPDDAPETWAITVAGCPTLVGMNETGLMVGTTNIKTWGARVGVGYMSILHQMLAQRSLEDAAKVVETAPRAGAHTYWLASPDGVAEYEATPERTVRRDSSDAAIIRTNHTLDPTHRRIEWQPPSSSSLARLERLTSCAASDAQDLDSLIAAFADRSDGVDSVNRYEEDGQGTATNAVMVGEPATRTLRACRGPADRGEWVTLSFER